MIQNIYTKKKNSSFLKILLVTFLLLLSACSQNSDDSEDDTVNDIKNTNDPLTCIRWIDRDLYFAKQDPFISNRNNEFHKTQVQEIISTIEKNTSLGEGYFRVKTVSPEVLDPLRTSSLPKDEIRSFILIWEDSRFEEFITSKLGGFGNVPDRNAITIVNPNYQRKFYMIIRASCFEASERCSASDNDSIAYEGVSALIARQLGFLFRLPNKDCVDNRDDVMCPQPSDDQWTEDNREEFYSSLSNQMTVIDNNPNYYGDVSSSFNCLHRPWMDKRFNVGCPSEGKNNVFDLQTVLDTLNEISCSSLLGCNYFDTEYAKNNCTSESQIPLDLERTEYDTENESYLMIWPDLDFNEFVNGNDVNIPDPNSMLFINSAKKSNFTMIFRGSCFGVNEESCDGGNGGISIQGTKALIARQLGMMVGLDLKDCDSEPYDVMCADLPSDFQWRNSFKCYENPNHQKCQELLEQCLQQNEYTDCTRSDNTGLVDDSTVIISSKNRFFNKLNNALEVIGNNPNFYDQFFENNDENLDE